MAKIPAQTFNPVPKAFTNTLFKPWQNLNRQNCTWLNLKCLHTYMLSHSNGNKVLPDTANYSRLVFWLITTKICKIGNWWLRKNLTHLGMTTTKKINKVICQLWHQITIRQEKNTMIWISVWKREVEVGFEKALGLNDQNHARKVHTHVLALAFKSLLSRSKSKHET